MGRKFNQSRTTIEEVHAHVMRRNWKHYAVTAAIAGGVVFGAAEGGKMVVESHDQSTHQSTDGGKLGLGLLWMTLASITGVVGAGVMLPKLARDQRSLVSIEASMRSGTTHFPIFSKQRTYQKNVDDQYETFGEGHQRVQTKMRQEFAGAAGLAVVGSALVLDTVFANPLSWTHAIMLLVGHNVNVAQNLAGIGEAVIGSAFLGWATTMAVAGGYFANIRKRMKADVNQYGADARVYKRMQPSDGVKMDVRPV
jgi:hypothetical protein